MVMLVLDASSILNFGRRDGVTVKEVLDEIRDWRSRTEVQAALDSGELRVLEPSKESIAKARAAAGDERLSETDVRVLALALEHGDVVTDDHAMQRVATILKIKFHPVMFKPSRLPRPR